MAFGTRRWPLEGAIVCARPSLVLGVEEIEESRKRPREVVAKRWQSRVMQPAPMRLASEDPPPRQASNLNVICGISRSSVQYIRYLQLPVFRSITCSRNLIFFFSLSLSRVICHIESKRTKS